MTSLSTSRNIEILPTFTAVQFGALDDTTGAFVNDRADPPGGLNFKYGVTSNLTADLTLNPDFSQIESDRPQIAVNQRFDLFFPELRPFFLEGAEIFSVGGHVTMVNTRTIADPLYGAKLTGKASSTTIGVMYANDEALGALAERDDPVFGARPRRSWVVSATTCTPSLTSVWSSPTVSSSIVTAGRVGSTAISVLVIRTPFRSARWVLVTATSMEWTPPGTWSTRPCGSEDDAVADAAGDLGAGIPDLVQHRRSPVHRRGDRKRRRESAPGPARSLAGNRGALGRQCPVRIRVARHGVAPIDLPRA